MYKINYRTKRCYLDESVRAFKRIAVPFIPPIKTDDTNKLKVSVEYHGKFLNKDGTIKRKDGQNLDKALYDIIFEKIGVDDKVVWEGSFKKIHDPDKEFTRVTIEECED